MSELKTITEHIREHLLKRSGYFEIPKRNPNLDWDKLKESQWSKEFEQYMRNRLICGAFRYGGVRSSKWKTPEGIKNMHKRIDMYEEDGNLEHLVDLANIALVEFLNSTHPKKHFKGTDYHEYHIEIKEK